MVQQVQYFTEVGEHLTQVVHRLLSKIEENRQFELAKDPVEALHDLRVASRRLRVFVEMFEPLFAPVIGDHANKPLRKITKAIRAIRDCDVLLRLLQERHARAVSDVERILLEDLSATAAHQRKVAAKRTRKRLNKLDFDALSAALCASLGITITKLAPTESSVPQLLWQLLQPFADTDLSCLPEQAAVERVGDMHQLRIRFKKLRYALELVQPALGSAFERLYAPIETMQDLLGNHQDLVVLSELIAERRSTLEREQRRTLARALDVLSESLLAERRSLAAACPRQAFDPTSWRHDLQRVLEVGPAAA